MTACAKHGDESLIYMTNTSTCNKTCNKKQVTGKLKNPDDSLLTPDSDECKEHKSKLDTDLISRQAVTDYLNERLDGRYDAVKSAMIQGIRDNIRLLPPITPTVSEDCISRDWIIDYCNNKVEHYRQRLKRIEKEGENITYDPEPQIEHFKDEIAIYESFAREMQDAPSVTPTEQTIKEIMDFIGGMNMVDEISNEAYTKISVFVDDGTPTERTVEWIPVSERLPEKNGDYIVSLEDSIYPWGRFFNGKWYMLPRGGVAVEFGAYEVIAWRPLPDAYKGGDTE